MALLCPASNTKEQATIVTIDELCTEVRVRIGRYHRAPNSMFITANEMRTLAAVYPESIILTALTHTAGVVRKFPSIERSRFLRTVQNLCERLLVSAHAHGKFLEFKGSGIPVRDRQPNRTPREAQCNPIVENVELILDCFQANCSDDGLWTYTEDVAKDLLKRYSIEALRETMLSLGRFDTDHAQESLDLLCWRCEQKMLTTA
jgi:hypothetical protein